MEGRSVHEGHLCSVRPPMKCHYSTYSVETMIGVVVVVCGGDARLPHVVLVKVCTRGSLVLRAAANEIPLLYLLGGDDDCGGDAVVLE